MKLILSLLVFLFVIVVFLVGEAYADSALSGHPSRLLSTENIATGVGSVGTSTAISLVSANETRKKQDEEVEKIVTNKLSLLERRIDELSRENLKIEKARLKSEEDLRNVIRHLATRIKHIETHLTKNATGFIPK